VPVKLTSLLLCLALVPTAADAQGDLSRVFPNGAQRGSRVKLTLGGEGLPDPGTLLVEGEGIRSLGPFVKGEGEIEIAADAAPGVRQLRLVGSKSSTTPRPFAVGALPEIAEKEPNDRAAQAQPLDSLPVTLNGRLPNRPDIDTFRVTLKQGQCLVVAGEARALGAPTNLLVRVRDMVGRELLVQLDSRTRDPLLGFTAPADGDYLVELQEVMNNYSNLSDDYVYRVTLTTGPWLDRFFPLAARRGTTARLTFHGWNLGGQRGPGQLAAEVAVPADAGPRFAVSAGGAPNQVSVLTSAVPEMVEPESDPGESPPALTLPAAVSGTFAAPGDRDPYRFTASAGQPLRIAVQARALDSAADPVLLLWDAAGKLLTMVDDGGRDSRDPSLVWTPPADGEYRVVLRDVAGGFRGGPDFFYRLTIAPTEPELRLATPAPSLVLKPGAKLEVPLTVTQSFQPAEVVVAVEGLPTGVTATPLAVPGSPGSGGRAELKLTLAAAMDAAPTHARLRIVARAGSLTAPAIASWVLSKDRSGTLVDGEIEGLLLVVEAP
jgi:hypothetical protein